MILVAGGSALIALATCDALFLLDKLFCTVTEIAYLMGTSSYIIAHHVENHSLAVIMENSHALAGDPMEIQEKLRNEWN